MQKAGVFNNSLPTFSTPTIGLNIRKKTIVGLILTVALFAFEIFNFDTTRYALNNLLGDVSFWKFGWATILAIAFCAIDFAGLARIFTPEQGADEPKAVWYLMGAWLLGATMNAVMTWWAVSLTLLSHNFGNEVLSRAQLLQTVPIFVATLVWLTRILFIGAFSVAGEHLFDLAGTAKPATAQSMRAAQAAPLTVTKRPLRENRQGPANRSVPQTAVEQPTQIHRRKPQGPLSGPPMPGPRNRPQPIPLGAQSRRRR